MSCSVAVDLYIFPLFKQGRARQVPHRGTSGRGGPVQREVRAAQECGCCRAHVVNLPNRLAAFQIHSLTCVLQKLRGHRRPPQHPANLQPHDKHQGPPPKDSGGGITPDARY